MKSGGTVAGAGAVASVAAARSSSPRKALLLNMFPAATVVDLSILTYVGGLSLFVVECAHRTAVRLKSGTVIGERSTRVRKIPFHAGHKEIDILQINSSRCRVEFYGGRGIHWG